MTLFAKTQNNPANQYFQYEALQTWYKNMFYKKTYSIEAIARLW